MNNSIFSPTDILIPDSRFLEKWSVIACDQFSSERDYWERVQGFIGDAPSSRSMIIPEAYLTETDEDAQTEKICAAMEEYLEGDIFSEVKDSFIYVERTLPDGRVRHGIVGAIDLEEYDFTGKHTAIRASEGTILDRLPARIKIRKAAPLEMPHIIAFINDKSGTVVEPLAKMADTLPTVYDFALMEGGGSIKGKRLTGYAADGVMAAMDALCKTGGGSGGISMIIGDGNHSLAAAKVYWDEIKQSLGEAERETHPARRALVEVCNVYDPAIDFEAIHRVIFGIDADEFIGAFVSATHETSETAHNQFDLRRLADADYVLRWVSSDGSGEIGIDAECIGDMLVMVQGLIDEYVKQSESTIDYVHGADSVERLAQGERRVGLILPAMDKSEFFETVANRGVFPKKSFSVGHARDKRYYLECRRIAPTVSCP